MSRPKKAIYKADSIPFVQNVEMELAKKKKTWEDLIDTCDFSREVAKSWVNGHKQPNLDNVAEVAAALKVNPKSLLIGWDFNSRGSEKVVVLINEIAEKKKVTQRDIYKDYQRIGLSKQTVYNVMSLGMKPGYKVLAAFAKALQVSPLDLISFKK